MPMRVQPLDGAFGVRITDVDLSAPLDDATFGAIRQALVDHHVVAIAGQHLSAGELVAFSERFGELEPHLLTQFHHPDHPAVLTLSNWRLPDGSPKGAANPPDPIFHSDLSYRPTPTWVTLLYAVTVPDHGGDTLFADMAAAYDALPADLRDRLDGLRAAHNYAYRYPERMTDAQRDANPDVVHPVVRLHPDSLKKAVFINPSFTGPILGLPADEGEALKARIYDHCLADRFRLRYRWRQGDLLMWDNAAVVHSATPAPEDQERTMLRTTVVGGAPVPV